PSLTGLPKPRGQLARSGILDTQAERVAEFYRDDLELDPLAEKSEWCRISGRKLGYIRLCGLIE
ncbi:50S ribosomal protein L11 methyltransferase, partial [Vibrio cholerae O1]|uniref:50S ribosomal protein L11 methyltransferase n=1 Tax=Vibrio cholerae TaxID=666 RepID=UPI001C11500B